jgi:hypothetical protein
VEVLAVCLRDFAVVAEDDFFVVEAGADLCALLMLAFVPVLAGGTGLSEFCFASEAVAHIRDNAHTPATSIDCIRVGRDKCNARKFTSKLSESSLD